MSISIFLKNLKNIFEIKEKIASVSIKYKKFKNRCQGTVRFSFYLKVLKRFLHEKSARYGR